MNRKEMITRLLALLLKLIGLLPIAGGFLGATFGKEQGIVTLLGIKGLIALLFFEGLFLLIIEILIIVVILKVIAESFTEKETL
jgi:hypothetical protein